jgi:hypothetical protein
MADALSGAGNAIIEAGRSRVAEAGAGPLAILLARFVAAGILRGAFRPAPGRATILLPGDFGTEEEIPLGDYDFEAGLNSLPWAGPDVNLAVGSIRSDPNTLAVSLEVAAQLARQVNRKVSPCEACIRKRIWPQGPDVRVSRKGRLRVPGRSLGRPARTP